MEPFNYPYWMGRFMGLAENAAMDDWDATKTAAHYMELAVECRTQWLASGRPEALAKVLQFPERLRGKHDCPLNLESFSRLVGRTDCPHFLCYGEGCEEESR